MGRASEGRIRRGNDGVTRRSRLLRRFQGDWCPHQHLAEARSNSTNPLLSEVAQVRSTGFGITSSPQEIETETIQALRSSMSTLKAKAPDDAQVYRDFVLNVAKSVGEAVKGTATSESDAIQKIDAALASS